MNDGYRPHASYITKTLILTFAMGVAVGIAIGWGANSSWKARPSGSGGELAQRPEPEAPKAGQPDMSAAAPAVAPVAEAPVQTAPAVPPAQSAPVVLPPFEPAVDGLWPAEHLFVGVTGAKADVETLEWLIEFKPGGVVLGPENVTDALQLSALVLQIKQAVGLGTTIADPPVILYRDDRAPLPRLLGAPLLFAANAPIGIDTIDTVTGQARDARSHGIGAMLAPSLDIFIPNTSNVDLAGRTLGGAPDPVTELGLAVAERLRGAGVLPVAMHFPGAGLAESDGAGHWFIPAGQMDALAEAMQPFKAAVDAGIPGILVGHMAVPGIDTDRPNRPASLSPRLLQVLVRGDWGYTGVLLADDITDDPMTRDLPRDEIVLKALVSGCDAVILQHATRTDLRLICDTFVRLSQRSDFPADSIQASKERLRGWLKTLDGPLPVTAPKSPEPAVVAAVETPVAPPLTEKGDGKEPPSKTAAKETSPTATPGTDISVTAKAGDTAPESSGPAPVAATKPEVEGKTNLSDAPAPEPAVDATAEVKTPAAGIPTAEPPAAESPTLEVKGNETPKETLVSADGTVSTPAKPAPGTNASETPAVGSAPPDTAGTTLIEHTIAKGESLTVIASHYKVKTGDIKAWNNLEDENIKYGRKLKIHLPAGSATPEGAKGAAEAPKPGDGEVSEPTEPTANAGDAGNADSGSAAADKGAAPATLPENEAPVPAEATPLAENALSDENLPTAPKDGSSAEMALESITVPGGDAVPPESPETGAPTAPEEKSTPEIELVASEPVEVLPQPDAIAEAATPTPVPQPENTKKREHTVRPGETPELIAAVYGVTLAEVRAWNGLAPDQSNIETGRTLALYLPTAEPAEGVKAVEAAKPAEEVAKPTEPAEVVVKPADPAPGTFELYEVAPGDNLRRIAQRFGTTQKTLIEWNKIDQPDHVQIGWKLKVPKQAENTKSSASESSPAP